MTTPFAKALEGWDGTTESFLKIDFGPVAAEEQRLREKAEDAVAEKVDEAIAIRPHGHPRRCGLPGCHGDD